MGAQLDLAKNRLFSKEGFNTRNIKLFPGSSRDATPEQVAEQINRALFQIESGDVEFVDNLDD